MLCVEPGTGKGSWERELCNQFKVVPGCKAEKVGQIQEIAKAYGSILLYINI